MKSWAVPLWVTVIFLASMILADGQVAAQGKLCGVLVTEGECRAYLGRLDHAETDRERMEIETAHVKLLKERARLCPSQGAMHGSMKTEPLPSQGGLQRDIQRGLQRDLQRNTAPRIWM